MVVLSGCLIQPSSYTPGHLKRSLSVTGLLVLVRQSFLLSSSGKGSGMRSESGKQKQRALLRRSALKMVWKKCRTGETEMVNQNEKGARVMGDPSLGHGLG